MHAYEWSSLTTASWTLAVLLAALVLVRLLDHLPAPDAVRCGWLLCVTLLGTVVFLVAGEPAGTRMVALVVALFVVMKGVSLAAARAEGAPALGLRRWLVFTLAWYGMNPRAFARRRARDRSGALRLARRGARNAIAGMLLIGLALQIGSAWAAPILMVGLSLLVHFGVFTLLAALWQARGFAVRALFDAPLRSRTPNEFWAQRWNRGFAELTALCVYRPLVGRFGRRGAFLAGFAVSGLFHEVVISVPVRAGYGLPTAYFLLQGLVAWQAGNAPQRLYTLLAIGLPLPVVFHPWFVEGVCIPLLG
jgi:alginate O-acetyltransferase complex protein AlgI